ncbi:hypothetical protein ACFVUS_10365 [Nocardia sp. NPDC058058]|uniref:hypothetical protein n=1 Tax=Nocardia sp. NPDC058058 TaxID=3346317 RepID=UPI0036DF1441
MGRIYVIDVDSTEIKSGDRNSIGGWPLLEADQPWPVCGCGQRMVLYFQVQVPADIPVFGGEQLLVFQCPVESDCPWFTGEQLPEKFWDEFDGRRPFWRILLQRNGIPTESPDPILTPTALSLSPDTDTDDDDDRPYYGFKIGGAPRWFQGPESQRCACGTDLAFLAQVPEDFSFYDFKVADEDDDSDDDDSYPAALDDGLFVGNQVYILACPSRCDPAAAWPICQN